MASQNALATHALQAEKHLEQLATGMGQAGAPPETVKGLTQMAEAMRKLVKALSKPGPAQPAPAQQPAPEAAPKEGQPLQEEPQQQPRSVGEATDQMMEDHKKRRMMR